MSIDLGDARTAISQVLADTPDGENPWTRVGAILRSQVEWDVSRSFRPQLYVLSALLVIVTLTLAASVVVRWLMGQLWLVRGMRTSGGLFVVPHYLTTWSIFTVIFLSCVQGFIWETVAKSRKEKVSTIVLWETLTWLPAWLAFWWATCSLVTTHILHLESSGRQIRSIFARAIFTNAMTLVVPVLFIASIVALGVNAQRKYQAASDLFLPLAQAVAKAAATYNGTVDPSLVESEIAQGQEFLDSMSSFINYFRATWFAYTGWTILLILIFSLASFLHLSELSRTMQDLHTRSQISDGGNTHADTDTETNDQEDIIHNTYLVLVRITIFLFLAFAAFVSMLLFVAASGRKIVTNMVYLQTAHLMPIYTFALLGLPLSFLLFRQSLTTSSHRQRQEQHENETEQGPDSNNSAAPADLSTIALSPLQPAHSHQAALRPNLIRSTATASSSLTSALSDSKSLSSLSQFGKDQSGIPLTRLSYNGLGPGAGSGVGTAGGGGGGGGTHHGTASSSFGTTGSSSPASRSYTMPTGARPMTRTIAAEPMPEPSRAPGFYASRSGWS